MHSVWLTLAPADLCSARTQFQNRICHLWVQALPYLVLQEQVAGDVSDARHQETMAAIQAEVARLEAAQSIQRAADSALDSLQDKITVMQVRPCTAGAAELDAYIAVQSMGRLLPFDQQHAGHQDCIDACCGVSSIAVFDREPEAGRRCFAWHAELVQPWHCSRYGNNHTVNAVFSACILALSSSGHPNVSETQGKRTVTCVVDTNTNPWNHHSPSSAGNGPPIADAQSMVMPRAYSVSDEAEEDGPLMASPSSTPHG